MDETSRRKRGVARQHSKYEDRLDRGEEGKSDGPTSVYEIVKREEGAVVLRKEQAARKDMIAT